jgi:hypothetical protein
MIENGEIFWVTFAKSRDFRVFFSNDEEIRYDRKRRNPEQAGQK